MRTFGIFGVLLAVTSARADTGFYARESIGVASYRGGLRAYGADNLRLDAALGIRRGQRSYELVAGVILEPYYEPYEGGYISLGIDRKQEWPVLRTWWPRLNMSIAAQAGPRIFMGDGALWGYTGVGAHGHVALEANAWLLGFTVEVGMDAMWMAMPVDQMAGFAPNLMFGCKAGWL